MDFQDEFSYDEEEGYETDEYFDEQGRKVVEIDYNKLENADKGAQNSSESKKQYEPKFEHTEIRYNIDDMNPEIRDPRCNSSTGLACLWPVYVDNFKDEEIANYFASHGLHVRWWFRKSDQYYNKFQRRAQLYDMLVYFVSETDANLAIERCHRDTYKGYTLNVFPGREPVYFAEDRSVYVNYIKGGRFFSEHFLERRVRKKCNVNVECVVKFDMNYGALEFSKPEDVSLVRKAEKLWKYLPVRGKLQKQRFIEKDVIDDIHANLAEYPEVLNFREDDRYLNMLLAGRRPIIDRNRKYRVSPLRRGSPKQKQMFPKKFRWYMTNYPQYKQF